MPEKRILSVGQCDVDHASISEMLKLHWGAETMPVKTLGQALEAVRHHAFELILVNRILDADGTSGLDVIKRLKTEDASKGTPIMLVTNFPEFQTDAVQMGALPGFGKAALHDYETIAKLNEVLV
jgi:two-component system chemotaxis response regulator CheY